MTRKALRKRLRCPSKQSAAAQSTSRGPSPWMTVGALVATAALTTARSTTASAAELEFRGGGIVREPPAATFVGRSTGCRNFVIPDAAPSTRCSASGLSSLARRCVPGSRVISGAASSPLRHSTGPSRRRVESLRAGDWHHRVTLSIEAIGTIQSPGVAGLFSFERALEAMLVGTSVTFRLTSPNAAVLELRAQTESVEVTGRAPTAIVSSPKYTAPLREIPQTIEVIPRAVMEAQGVTTLSEALRNVPGITLQAGEGGGASSTAGDMFNMRGFNAANSLFVDGVRDDGLDLARRVQPRAGRSLHGSRPARTSAAARRPATSTCRRRRRICFRRVRPVFLRQRRPEAAHARRQPRRFHWERPASGSVDPRCG